MFEDRKEKCFLTLKQNFPQTIRPSGEIDESFFHLKKQEEIPSELVEYFMWDNLQKELYWRSLNELEVLYSIGRKDSFSEEDLKSIKEEMVKQAIEGKQVASVVPLFSDVWNIIGKKESPLEKFVLESDKKTAVNLGFWHLLAASSNSEKERCASEQLNKIIDYDDFFKYYDFANGSLEAQKLQARPNFEHFGSFNAYIRWLLVQEVDICRRFEDNESNKIVGRLTAPIISSMLRKKSSEDWLVKVSRLFVRREIIKTPDMQEVLGKLFEEQLYYGFLQEDYDSRLLELCVNNLVDKNPYISRAFEKATKCTYSKFDVISVNPKLKVYIPKSVHEKEISELEEKLKATNKIDTNLFFKWLDLKPEQDISKAKYRQVRNRVLDIYFSQKQRPASSQLFELSRRFANEAPGTNYIFDKLNAFLFSDLLLRRQWRQANELLLRYRAANFKPISVFFNGIKEYTETHRKIPLKPEGLLPNACYPHYNCIPNLQKSHSELFKPLS